MSTQQVLHVVLDNRGQRVFSPTAYRMGTPTIIDYPHLPAHTENYTINYIRVRSRCYCHLPPAGSTGTTVSGTVAGDTAAATAASSGGSAIYLTVAGYLQSTPSPSTCISIFSCR